MKILFAQGNPGDQYATTRHNVGWILLDTLASSHDTSFKLQPKFSASIAELTLNGEKVLLVKPTTFYNETGRAARALVDFYKLNPATDVLVIHDDLALPFGTIRVRQKGSDAGNNGIKSLNAYLGQHYWRMRVGVWNERRDQTDDASFVLSKLSHDEYTSLTQTLYDIALGLIELFYTEELSATSRDIKKDTP